MQKKLAMVYLFFIACVIHLGHSLFPHVHLKEHHHHTGDNHHHHEEDSEENGLSLFFSHFNYTSDNFTKGHSEEEIGFIDLQSLHAIPTDIKSISTDFFCSSTKKLIKNYPESLFFISPHLNSLQFRGPPILFS